MNAMTSVRFPRTANHANTAVPSAIFTAVKILAGIRMPIFTKGLLFLVTNPPTAIMHVMDVIRRATCVKVHRITAGCVVAAMQNPRPFWSENTASQLERDDMSPEGAAPEVNIAVMIDGVLSGAGPAVQWASRLVHTSIKGFCESLVLQFVILVRHRELILSGVRRTAVTAARPLHFTSAAVLR